MRVKACEVVTAALLQPPGFKRLWPFLNTHNALYLLEHWKYGAEVEQPLTSQQVVTVLFPGVTTHRDSLPFQ